MIVDRIEGLQRWEGEALIHFLWRVAQRDATRHLPPEPPVMDGLPEEPAPGREPGSEG